jgi:hypothetical protein
VEWLLGCEFYNYRKLMDGKKEREEREEREGAG